MIQIISGAPNKELMALIGMVYTLNCEIMSQTSSKDAPHKADAGITMLWLDDLNSPRAMCGTATPINAMGPVNAVVAPANRPVAMINTNRVFTTEMPKPRA